MRPATKPRRAAVRRTARTAPPRMSAATSAPRIGQPAPALNVQDETGRMVRLANLRGTWVVLYFYPKDDTPGCTREACAFRDGLSQLHARGAVVIGASPDSTASHQRFKTKFQLNFPLLSDTEQRVAQAYGVWKQKAMYGRTYMGIERTTFLINPQGRIARIFPKVQVDGHADEVLAALTEAR